MRQFSLLEDGHYVELIAPLKVYLDITSKCNLNCKFCFHKKTGAVAFSKEQLFSIVDMIVDANILELSLIGGEPLLCEHFYELVLYAKTKGLRLGIVTNGTKISTGNISIIKETIGSSISISLHAPNDVIHDQITGGTNSYTSVIKSLLLLNANHILPEISFTPCRDNVELLFDTIDSVLSKGIQISDLLVNRLIPGGNAYVCWKEIGLTYEDQIKLFKQMALLNEKYPDLKIGTGDALPFCMFEQKYWKYILRCDYAITLGWINEKGLFGKCMCRGSDKLLSIWDEDLQTIWRTSDSFTKYRDLSELTMKCRTCHLLEQCGGGCSCSSLNPDNNVDEFLDTSQAVPEINNEDIDAIIPEIKENSFIKCNDYDFRLEKYSAEKNECLYLAIPSFKEAIIRDNYIPTEGSMVWLNAVEKAIVEKCIVGFHVNELITKIRYEFALNYDEAKATVYKTIYNMYKYGVLTN